MVLDFGATTGVLLLGFGVPIGATVVSSRPSTGATGLVSGPSVAGAVTRRGCGHRDRSRRAEQHCYRKSRRRLTKTSTSEKEPRRSTERSDGATGSFLLMMSCDSEKREGVCHEPEPLLLLMGRAAAATGEVMVRQGSNVGKAVGILLRAMLKGMLYFCRENRNRSTVASQKRRGDTRQDAMETRCHLTAIQQLALASPAIQL
ncbi:hypothetical protein B296_00017055 [Ensete ventricosum]|uniref:Uncharacterized protein n=1 Tax=Ensete ventricosum TaxID=4639 RepID=A0A426Z1W0_ENSVE|nr:hypothetical protein B296_00017055 [Ensete ventricosum]